MPSQRVLPLRPTLERVAARAFPGGLGDAAILMLESPDLPIVHGAALTPGGLLSYYYLLEKGVGLAAGLVLGAPQVTLARIKLGVLHTPPQPRGEDGTILCH